MADHKRTLAIFAPENKNKCSLAPGCNYDVTEAIRSAPIPACNSPSLYIFLIWSYNPLLSGYNAIVVAAAWRMREILVTAVFFSRTS
jgi:hypothetical protein